MKNILITISFLILVSCDLPESGIKYYSGVTYKKDSTIVYSDTTFYLYVTAIKNGKTYKVEVDKIVYDSTMIQEKFHITTDQE